MEAKDNLDHGVIHGNRTVCDVGRCSSAYGTNKTVEFWSGCVMLVAVEKLLIREINNITGKFAWSCVSG
jgi:hypothetical protein